RGTAPGLRSAAFRVQHRLTIAARIRRPQQGEAMDQELCRSRTLAQALIVGAFICILWPSAEALAQEDAAPAAAAAASGAAPAETATQSRRDRRRAAQQQTATAAQEQTGTAAAKTDAGTDAAE